MNRLKKSLLYAGIDELQYQKIFPEIQLRNLRNLSIFSFGMFIYFTTFTIWAVITTGFHPLYAFYVVDSVFMVVFHFAVKALLRKNDLKQWVPIFMNYLFIAVIYADAMVITCFLPEKQSTAFFVRLVILPVVCMDTPLRMICFQIISVIVFSIITPLYNLPNVVEADQGEMVSYVIISIIICVFLTSSQIKEILNEINNNYLFHYDVLTGAKNRNSFEREHLNAQSEITQTYYYIYVDANGLHEVNNTYGHEAGDTMLKTIASGLIDHFGVDYTYRIGGDEFVSYTNQFNKKEILDYFDTFCKELAKFNYHIAFGVAGLTADTSSRQDVIKAAEQRMYTEKKKYYQANGVEFGTRKRQYD